MQIVRCFKMYSSILLGSVLCIYYEILIVARADIASALQWQHSWKDVGDADVARIF